MATDTKSNGQLAELDQLDDLQPERQRDWLKIGSTACLGLILLSQFNTCSRVGKLEKLPIPSLVQTLDGYGVAVAAKPSGHREPAVIKGFVKEWMPLMFNWDDVVGRDGVQVKDEGIMAGGGLLPSETWAAQKVLAEDFRARFVKTLHSQYGISEYLSGEKSRLINIQTLSEPKELRPGVYQVMVTAHWDEMTQDDKLGMKYAWNKRITLVAIEKPISPLEKDASAAEQAIYGVLSRGLKIALIENINNVAAQKS